MTGAHERTARCLREKSETLCNSRAHCLPLCRTLAQETQDERTLAGGTAQRNASLLRAFVRIVLRARVSLARSLARTLALRASRFAAPRELNTSRRARRCYRLGTSGTAWEGRGQGRAGQGRDATIIQRLALIQRPFCFCCCVGGCRPGQSGPEAGGAQTALSPVSCLAPRWAMGGQVR